MKTHLTPKEVKVALKSASDNFGSQFVDLFQDFFNYGKHGIKQKDKPAYTTALMKLSMTKCKQKESLIAKFKPILLKSKEYEKESLNLKSKISKILESYKLKQIDIVKKYSD